ncbi:hypothetical protein NE237_019768 [Protea cynaroides]|uniref:GH16 domain-containing protein n=1 Tax=Protea cynaroides TaxID=273540 RepID=A0A9Q0H7S1_9MAGN|nr:hypothetical protein NE237_019768 [Protea cynaroides]
MEPKEKQKQEIYKVEEGTVLNTCFILVLSAVSDQALQVLPVPMCSDTGAEPKRDELHFEFLGNRTGEPYLIQTNVYKDGVGGREMRHMLWFDPTEDFHS